MALADWFLPLLLMSGEDAHGRLPFDWMMLDTPALDPGTRIVTVPIVSPTLV